MAHPSMMLDPLKAASSHRPEGRVVLCIANQHDAGPTLGGFQPSPIRMRSFVHSKAPKRRKQALFLALLLVASLALTACAASPATTYKKAIDLFANGEYAEAARLFDQAGDFAQAPTYAAYSHGLTLFEQEMYVEAEPYFEKVRGFMHGEARYTYCHASALEQAGEYAKAAEAFLSLEEFENAQQRGYYCKARAAEIDGDHRSAIYAYEMAGDYGDTRARGNVIREQVYEYALKLKGEGDYERAQSLFGSLGEYLDSPDQAKSSKDAYRDGLMAEAEIMVQQGRLREAYDVFKGLSGYRDSGTWVEELGAQLGIPQEQSEYTEDQE